MTLFVLDTDTLTLYREGNAVVISRVAQTPPAQLRVSVISLEEQLDGWYRLLRQKNPNAQLSRLYDRLKQTAELYSTFQILGFSEQAIETYHQLLAMKLNVGKMDLRIAAITMEAGATVVTRNRRDFERVPGLSIEDWSQPASQNSSEQA